MEEYTTQMVRIEKHVGNTARTAELDRTEVGNKRRAKRQAHRGNRRFGRVECRQAQAQYRRK